MLDEYDFSRGVRGKHTEQYRAGSNVVMLAPEVAKVFPTAESVNDALRSFVKIVRKRAKKVSA
jgi:hypothetical protein